MARPPREARPREFGAADPDLFAPLTSDENRVLHAHLVSGWYKQGAVWPTLSGIWRETCEVLDDLHIACRVAFDAEQAKGGAS